MLGHNQLQNFISEDFPLFFLVLKTVPQRPEKRRYAALEKWTDVRENQFIITRSFSYCFYISTQREHC